MSDDPTVLGVRNDDRRTAVERINGSVPAAETTAMSPEQFEELKKLLIDLLTPGYELSKLILAQHQAQIVPPPPPANGPGKLGMYATHEEALAAKGDREIAIIAFEDGSFSLDEPPAA